MNKQLIQDTKIIIDKLKKEILEKQDTLNDLIDEYQCLHVDFEKEFE